MIVGHDFPLTRQSGFDLKQLFIGSEGSIGVITAISILCPRRPSAMNVAVFSVPSYEGVQKVFAETKSHLGEILSAFEFFDKQAVSLLDHGLHALTTVLQAGADQSVRPGPTSSGVEWRGQEAV